MTLRIPDDEVSRPQVAANRSTSSAPPAVEQTPAAIVTPMRIITINPEPSPSAPPVVEVPRSSAVPDVLPREESWTPLESSVADMSTEALVPIDSDPLGVDSAPESERETPAPPTPRRLATDDEVATAPRMEEDPSTPRVLSQAEPETERRSDPGDAPEISLEDLLAIEAAPLRAPAGVPPIRPVAPGPSPLPPAPSPARAPEGARPSLVIVPPHMGSVPPQSAEAVALRRKGRLWWEDLFNDDYLRTMEKLSDDQIGREVDFIEDSLGVERGGAVLDLACGTGRHAIDLAHRGYEVVGFDLSLAMLARAGEDAQDRDAKLNFVQGDMREMVWEDQFDGVYCWNTSFGYFEEDRNAQVVDRVHRSLKAGGLFLLDVVNRDFLIRQSPSLVWFEGEGCVCMDEMSVDFITSRMKVKRTMMLDDGRSREIEYSMRVYSLHELGKILHEHGFRVCEVSGRVATPGVFFGNESQRTIILSEKR
jgi:SAM-dependent methyltransferase